MGANEWEGKRLRNRKKGDTGNERNFRASTAGFDDQWCRLRIHPNEYMAERNQQVDHAI